MYEEGKCQALAVVLLVLHAFVDASTEKPNVLLLIADDLRPALGIYGEPVLSPNIDQLGKQSVVFTRAYAQQALCGPSRTSFLTSRRPDSTHLYDFYSYWRTAAGNFTSLPQYFKEHGYYSASFGKVFHPGIASGRHCDMPYSWSEPCYIAPTQQYKNAKVCPGRDGKLHKNLLCPVDVKKQPGGSLPDIEIADAAMEFIKKKRPKDKPFFLAVGFHKPHIPLKFPKEFLDLYPLSSIKPVPDPDLPSGLPQIAWNPWTDIREREDIAALNLTFPYAKMPLEYQMKIRQHYYAATSYMDSLVGKVLQTLDKEGLANNTVIAFTGDHGWAMGEHQEWSKYSNFEVSTRVPLIMSVPWLTQAKYQQRTYPFIDVLSNSTRFNLDKYNIGKGRFTEKLVELVDLFPTLVGVAGLPKIPECPVNSSQITTCTEGLSLLSLLKHNKSNEKHDARKKAVFSQYPRPSLYPQEDSDKPRLKHIKYMGYTMRTDRYRYTEWVSFNHKHFKPHWHQVHGKELYDYKFDSLEMNNQVNVSSYSNVVKKLAHLLHKGWHNALPNR